MARKNKSGDNSWLAQSGIEESSIQQESGDFQENSFLENDDEVQKIRDNLKGVPLIGKLKRKYQYAITLILSVITFTIAIYAVIMAYKNNEIVKDMKIATNNVANLMILTQKDVDNYAILTNENISKLNSSKVEIDKNIGILRSYENINVGAINSLDNYWKVLSLKVNIIENSKDKIIPNSILIKNSLINLNKNIVLIDNLIRSASEKSLMANHQIIYLTQIQNDLQHLKSGLVSLKSVGVDYKSTINEINTYNSVITKKIEALIASGLNIEMTKSLTIIKEDLTVASNNIYSVIQKLQPINDNLEKLKLPNENIEIASSQLKNSISAFESKDVFYNYILILISVFSSIFFFLSIIWVNSKELNKDLIVSEEIRRSLENSISRTVNDINAISSGNYSRKVRMTTDSLITLKDSINRLVETFVDKYESIYEITKQLKNDNNNYEKYLNYLFEKNTNMGLYKLELKESDKKNMLIMSKLSSKQNEVINNLNSLLPEYKTTNDKIDLYIETTKEIENKKNIIKDKFYKLDENFTKFKEGLDKLIGVCEFMEALSLNSEIVNNKLNNGIGSISSFNKIAEDFNAKAEDIKLGCLNMLVIADDVKNDLSTIDKNNKEIERHSNDTNSYFNELRKIFPKIGMLLSMLKTNQASFKQDDIQMKLLAETIAKALVSLEETLNQNENNLNEIKEINKMNKMKTNSLQQTVRFVEQLDKD